MTTPTDPQAHDAPLLWLVREKLHKGTTLAERVRKLRYKRRRPKPTPHEAQPSEVPVGEPAQEGTP